MIREITLETAAVRTHPYMTRFIEQPKSKPITVVCACIRNAGAQKVLLAMRRAPGVSGLDGKWELPGGKIEHGETPDLAVVREIREEIGLQVRPIRLLPYLHTNIWHYPHRVQHVILVCYECVLVGQETDINLPAHVRWCRIEDIDFATTLPGTREFVALVSEHKWFDYIFMRFEYVQPSGKSRREYTMVTQPTLFSKYGLVKYWGPIGSQGRMKIVTCRSPVELDEEIVRTAKNRLSNGYRLAEFEGPDKPYKTLLQVIEMAKRKNAYAVKH